ncbi:MAG: Smr/MutS family protein [Rhodospirillaceae bacterium]|nr:Smr/MutS family protein [Rhodospirillaceae bacterium]
MSRKDGRETTREEIRLWRHTMRDVQTLGHVPPPPEADLPDPLPQAVPQPVASDPAPLRRIAPVAHALPPLEKGRAPGVDKRTAERLRQGDRPIEARLDLHGMTRESAHRALIRFVADSFDAGRRCILVVTGKGTREGSGVLRAEVPHWLNGDPIRGMVLTFAQAKPWHGGDGALYLLLKRRRS